MKMVSKKISKVALGVALLGFAGANAQVTISAADGWLESAYAEWASDGSDSYNVYYSGAGASNVKVDAQLIRKYGSKFRVDAVGLKAGDYTLKVVSVKGGKEGASTTSKSLKVKAHDRSGFAFSNSHVPGAYKADGTLKSGAVVFYVTESTKNTITLDVVTSSKGATTACTGWQSILTAYKKGYDTRPLDFRLIGNVTDPAETDKGDILVDMGKKEGMSMTIEGIGNDATANGWGIRVKNAQDVEIRNLGIMNVDSDEGDNIGLQQDNKYVWVHNCVFDNLKKELREKPMTYKEFSEFLGISEKSLQNKMSGATEFTYSEIKRTTKYIFPTVKVSYLFDLDD